MFLYFLFININTRDSESMRQTLTFHFVERATNTADHPIHGSAPLYDDN